MTLSPHADGDKIRTVIENIEIKRKPKQNFRDQKRKRKELMSSKIPPEEIMKDLKNQISDEPGKPRIPPLSIKVQELQSFPPNSSYLQPLYSSHGPFYRVNSAAPYPQFNPKNAVLSISNQWNWWDYDELDLEWGIHF